MNSATYTISKDQYCMRYFSLFLSAFSIIVTALPLIESPLWWIRIFDFPRLQIAFVCLLAFILTLLFVKIKRVYKTTLLAVVAIAFLYQVSLIVVYTPLYPKEAKDSRLGEGQASFSLMVSNVLKENTQTEEFKRVVLAYKPDILLITEPNERWANHLTGLDSVFPNSIKYPLDNTYGMMLYSQLPLKNKEINFFVDKSVPSFYVNVTLPSGDNFDFYGVHPKPPLPGTSNYERDTEILIVGKKVREKGGPAIVAGDLNDVAWSRTTNRFQRYSRLLDPRQGRGLFNTYDAHNPLLRYPLDHIFYSDAFGLISIEKIDDNFGSDHFSMFVKLSYEPSGDHDKNLPEINKEDKQKIKRKINKEHK